MAFCFRKNISPLLLERRLSLLLLLRYVCARCAAAHADTCENCAWFWKSIGLIMLTMLIVFEVVR